MNSLTFKNLAPEQSTFLQAALDGTEEEFENSGEVLPKIAALTPDNQVAGTIVRGKTKEEVHRLITLAQRVMPVVYMAEGWIAQLHHKPDGAIARAMEEDFKSAVVIEPRLHPDRVEVVLLQFWHGPRHIVCHAAILRPATGKPTLGEWNSTDNAESKIQRCNFGPPGQVL